MIVKKKKLFLLLKACAVAVIVFSFSFSAVFAWYFKDRSLELPLLPAEFNVDIIFEDGKTDRLDYVARAATIYGDDELFDACVSCAQVKIKNRSDIAVRVHVKIAILGGVDEDGEDILIPIAESAIKYAIITNITREEITSGLDDGEWPDYSGHIEQQIEDLDAEDLDDMNAKALASIELDKPDAPPPARSEVEFLLAFWVDYNELVAREGYAPNIPEKQTTFSLRIHITTTSDLRDPDEDGG